MNEDQCRRLEAIEDKLLEVALQDADPANWSATGVLLCDMTKEQRGDAQWCRKTAVQTLALLNQVQRAVAAYRQPQKGVPPDDKDPDALIREAERKASEMLERIGAGPASRR